MYICRPLFFDLGHHGPPWDPFATRQRTWATMGPHLGPKWDQVYVEYT